MFEWDATHLGSVEDQSVSCVVCNLPFGKQIGSRERNINLYPEFVDEMARVIQPDGRIVLLSGDGQRLRQTLHGNKAFRISETVTFRLLGVQASVFVGQRI